MQGWEKLPSALASHNFIDFFIWTKKVFALSLNLLFPSSRVMHLKGLRSQSNKHIVGGSYSGSTLYFREFDCWDR